MAYSLTHTVLSKYAFEGDRPIIPLERITVPLNGIESKVAARQIELIDAAIDDMLRQGVDLAQQGNLAGLAGLDSSVRVALQQPIYDAWNQSYNLGAQHGLAAIQIAAPTLDILFNPIPLSNSPAEQAVLQRAIQLSGNFTNDMIDRLKQDIISSIQPDGTGNPINRRELRTRIAATLNVAESRAELIARTESTAAYNRGRLATYAQSGAVDAVRFLAVTDNRTTQICLSRNGLIWRVGDPDIANNTPPLHGRCRSVLSPILSQYNDSHAEMLADPNRNPANNTLEPLPKGWSTGASATNPVVAPSPVTTPAAVSSPPIPTVSAPVGGRDFGNVLREGMASDIANGDVAKGLEMISKAEANIQKVLAESRVNIAVPSEKIDEIIASGRLKSAFEVAGKGEYYGKKRFTSESDLFDKFYDKKPNSERPIYGYFASADKNDPKHETTRSFGDIFFRLKPEVNERASFTGNDSFMAATSSNLKDVHFASFYNSGYTAADITRIQNAKSAYELNQLTHGSFIEAQVHGQVRLNRDIESIVFRDSSKITSAVQAWAKANGVTIEVIQ